MSSVAVVMGQVRPRIADGTVDPWHHVTKQLLDDAAIQKLIDANAMRICVVPDQDPEEVDGTCWVTFTIHAVPVIVPT